MDGWRTVYCPTLYPNEVWVFGNFDNNDHFGIPFAAFKLPVGITLEGFQTFSEYPASIMTDGHSFHPFLYLQA